MKSTAVTICPTDLDEVCERLLAGGTGEAAVHRMDLHVVLQQLQSFEGLGTQEAGVVAVVCVLHQMVLQERVAQEALAADVAGEGVSVATVDPQVQLQLVSVPEGLPAQGAFERTEALPDEEVLQRRVLTRTGKAQSEERPSDEEQLKQKKSSEPFFTHDPPGFTYLLIRL